MYSKLLWRALIPLISTSELHLVFMVTRTLNLNFVDIVGIRVDHLFMNQTLIMTIHKSIEAAPSGFIRSSLPQSLFYF